ncbi:MAG: hypothetical protein O2892_10085 [Actinomycetota bacterium]|nr:hypothetical protein [Actinomycetota bacterium]
MNRIPHPVRGAYQYARPDIACPNCGAEPYAWCVQDGRHRQIPCVARLVKNTDDPEWEEVVRKPDLKIVPNPDDQPAT